jgi:hypothetical protein
MSIVTINGTEYNTEALSSEAKNELMSMQICDQKIAALQTDIAIAQTARNAYANALNGLLPKAAPKAKANKAKAKKA